MINYNLKGKTIGECLHVEEDFIEEVNNLIIGCFGMYLKNLSELLENKSSNLTEEEVYDSLIKAFGRAENALIIMNDIDVELRSKGFELSSNHYLAMGYIIGLQEKDFNRKMEVMAIMYNIEGF